MRLINRTKAKVEGRAGEGPYHGLGNYLLFASPHVILLVHPG